MAFDTNIDHQTRQEMMVWYNLLDLPYGSSETDVHKKFRSMGKLFHPDLHKGDREKEHLFKLISDAHDNLLKALKKAAQDAAIPARPPSFIPLKLSIPELIEQFNDPDPTRIGHDNVIKILEWHSLHLSLKEKKKIYCHFCMGKERVYPGASPERLARSSFELRQKLLEFCPEDFIARVATVCIEAINAEKTKGNPIVMGDNFWKKVVHYPKFITLTLELIEPESLLEKKNLLYTLLHADPHAFKEKMAPACCHAVSEGQEGSAKILITLLESTLSPKHKRSLKLFIRQNVMREILSTHRELNSLVQQSEPTTALFGLFTKKL